MSWAETRWHLATDDWHLLAPAGIPIPLSSAERCVLRCLFAADGAAVTREALIVALHGDEADFDPHRLDMLIYRLRRKAKGLGVAVLPLVTVRGCGYAFVARGVAS